MLIADLFRIIFSKLLTKIVPGFIVENRGISSPHADRSNEIVNLAKVYGCNITIESLCSLFKKAYASVRPLYDDISILNI